MMTTGQKMEDYEDIPVWWHPASPEHEPERTEALRKLIIEKMLVYSDLADWCFTGYIYEDGSCLHVFWGESGAEHGPDIAFKLTGEGFDINFRLTLYLHDSTFEDSLWIDEVRGDDVLHQWIELAIERRYINMKLLPRE